jgi:hypothetical protein
MFVFALGRVWDAPRHQPIPVSPAYLAKNGPAAFAAKEKDKR